MFSSQVNRERAGNRLSDFVTDIRKASQSSPVLPDDAIGDVGVIGRDTTQAFYTDSVLVRIDSFLVNNESTLASIKDSVAFKLTLGFTQLGYSEAEIQRIVKDANKQIEREYLAIQKGCNQDLYAMRFLYEEGFAEVGNGSTAPGVTASALYNGNISGILWQGHSNLPANDTKIHGYAFHYDPSDRLLKGEYSGWSPQFYGLLGLNWTGNAGRYAIPEGIGYDMNGNIQTMKRNGVEDVQSNVVVWGVMDEMTYHYNGNQLESIEDNVAYMGGVFEQFRKQSPYTGNAEYFYDGNGRSEATGAYQAARTVGCEGGL